jgi:hypothetical protein
MAARWNPAQIEQSNGAYRVRVAVLPPLLPPEGFPLGKERVEMDINGYLLAGTQESGENG